MGTDGPSSTSRARPCQRSVPGVLSRGRAGALSPVAVGIAVAGAVAVAVAGWALRLPADGLPLVPVLGLAAVGSGDVERLIGKIERFLAGEDVAFETDREDELGRLYGAVEEMAAAAHERERTRFALDATDSIIYEVDLHSGAETRQGPFERLYGVGRAEVPDSEAFFERCVHPEDRDRLRELERPENLEASGGSMEYDYRTNPDDGEMRWIHTEAFVRRGDTEERTLFGLATDVTERKERERRLRETKRRLDLALEGTDTGIWEWNVDTGEITWDETAERIVGLEPGSFGGTYEDFAETVHPEDRERVEAAIERTVETGDLYSTEYRYLGGDGEVGWVEVRGHLVTDEDGTERMIGIVHEITDRRERERELERTRDLLAKSQRIADVGGWELDVRGDSRTLTWTEEVYRIHGLPTDAAVDLADGIGYYHPQDRKRVESAVERAIAAGAEYDIEARLITAAGEQRWVRSIGVPVRENGETVAVRGSIQDVTVRKERELALESLHETTRGLLRTDTDADAAGLVVESAADVLDVEGTALYLLDAQSNELDAVAYTEGFEDRTGGAPSVRAGEESLLWNCYVSGTPTGVDGTGTVGSPFDGAGGGLVVPVGDHGVFVVLASDPIDDGTRRLVETLVATAEAAFDRIESEETVRQRDAELERRNRRLERQIQITDIIRRVDQSLVDARSREEIEATVCDRLVDFEGIALAWIGDPAAAGERLTPRAWAGESEGYLDAVRVDPTGESTEPAVVAARTGEPAVVGNVLGELKRDAWRREALAHDVHSVLGVPLAFGDYSYGVLAVYGTEPGAFGDLEQSVFAELGESIAHSINAVEARRALHAESLVELTLEFDPDDDLLGRIATDAGCDLAFEGLATYTGEEARLFVVAGADTGALASVLEDHVAVREYSHVADTDDGVVFEVTVTDEVLPVQFVRHGASPRAVRAADGEMEAVVDVPTATDVRTFVEMLRDVAPSASLVGRRTVERGADTRHDLISSLLDGLTDRQLEVLRTAYLAGFFEWPRESTGQDVAELLGVSQPTVNRHLRLGQRRLLARLFEEYGGERAAEDVAE